MWEDKHIQFLKDHIDDYTDKEFAYIFATNRSTVADKIRELKLNRSKERKSELQRDAANKLWKILNADPERKKDMCKRRNEATTRTNRAIKQSELFRVNRLGMPQKTKWILESNPKERNARYYLIKRRNYMADKGSKVIYYDDLTERSAELEERYNRKYQFIFKEAI